MKSLLRDGGVLTIGFLLALQPLAVFAQVAASPPMDMSPSPAMEATTTAPAREMTETASTTNETTEPIFVDDTPPSITSVALASTATSSATFSVTTDEPTIIMIEYGTTENYTSATPWSEEFSMAQTVMLADLEPETVYHYRVIAEDESGNVFASVDDTFTTDSLPAVAIAPPPAESAEEEAEPSSTATSSAPVFSDIAAQSIGASTADIVWNTDTLADSTVRYGTTAGYEAGDVHDAILKNDHEIFLADLVASTTYHFQVLSADAVQNTAVSKDFTFTTTGITSSSEENVTSTTTSTVAELETELENLEGEVAQEVASSSQGTIPEIINPQTPLPSLAGTPNLKIPVAIRASILAAGGKIPDLPPTPTVIKTEGLDGQVAFLWNTFGPAAKNLQVRIVRSTSGSPVHENDGVIIYQGGAGSFTDTNVVNGQTYHYAIYTIGKFRGISVEPHLVSITPTAGIEQIDVGTTFAFSTDLSFGMQSDNVSALQTFLDDEGYYPEGLITGYFGTLTQAALIRFQQANGIQPASGYFGPITREAIIDTRTIPQ